MPPLLQHTMNYTSSTNPKLTNIACFSYMTDSSLYEPTILKLMGSAYEAANKYKNARHNLCARINHEHLVNSLVGSSIKVNDVTTLYTDNLGPHLASNHHILQLQIDDMYIAIDASCQQYRGNNANLVRDPCCINEDGYSQVFTEFYIAGNQSELLFLLKERHRSEDWVVDMLDKQPSLRQKMGIDNHQQNQATMLPLYQNAKQSITTPQPEDPKCIVERINRAYHQISSGQPVNYPPSQRESDWNDLLNACQNGERWAIDHFSRMQEVLQHLDEDSRHQNRP